MVMIEFVMDLDNWNAWCPPDVYRKQTLSRSVLFTDSGATLCRNPLRSFAGTDLLHRIAREILEGNDYSLIWILIRNFYKRFSAAF